MTSIFWEQVDLLPRNPWGGNPHEISVKPVSLQLTTDLLKDLKNNCHATLIELEESKHELVYGSTSPVPEHIYSEPIMIIKCSCSDNDMCPVIANRYNMIKSKSAKQNLSEISNEIKSNAKVLVSQTPLDNPPLPLKGRE